MKVTGKKISDLTSFPQEVISNIPHIELTGNSLYIENHRGVKLLKSEMVIINLFDCELIAEGSSIGIKEINCNSISLTGIFTSLKIDKKRG